MISLRISRNVGVDRIVQRGFGKQRRSVRHLTLASLRVYFWAFAVAKLPGSSRTFLTGYWNQMADELYSSFEVALSDFRVTEGDRSYQSVIGELEALHAAGRFLPVARVQSAYDDPFWKGYGRIVVLEDLTTIGIAPSDGS